MLYTQTKSGVTKRKLDIPQVNGVGGGDGVFLIESQLSQSYVYALKKEGTPRVLALKGYVNSIGRWDGVYYYIREEGQQNYIVSRSDDKEDILLASNTRMRQLLYAGDATLLYNADENGIVYLSNVNEVGEMVEMMAAARSYQNNVEVVNTARELMMRTLDIIKN